MKYSYIRPKHYVTYYTWLLLFNVVCFFVFFGIAYLDDVNMINNGYVNKNSVTFRMEAIKQPIKESSHHFILFQYRTSVPTVKHVWSNGKIKLPPIKESHLADELNQNGDVAIIGESVKIDQIPSGYQFIGYFDTPDSYKLQTEIWLLSKQLDIDLNNGTQFILNTPSHHTEEIMREITNNNTVKIINKEKYGSYALKSNQFATVVGYVTIFFITILFVIVSIAWLSKESSLISILYLSGYSIRKICSVIIKYKVLPYIFFSVILIIISVIVQSIMIPLWSTAWILYSTYMIILYSLILLWISYTYGILYSVRRGGKKW